MTNKKISDFDEEKKNCKEKREESPEDLCTILMKTQKEFRLGNESASKYESSPGEVLRDYQEFN